MNTYSTRRPWSWWHISFWAVALVLVYLWQGHHFLRILRPGPNVTVDFFQEWASANFFFEGLPVYTAQDEQSVERHLGQKRNTNSAYLEVNAHPPTSVLVALPFAALPYNNACLVWNLLSLIALAVSLVVIARQLNLSLSPWALLPAITLLLICQPLYAQTYYGQFNLFLLLLIAGAWAADRAGRPWQAGALLGTAAALKLFPAFLLLPFLLRRRWHVLASAAVGGAAWTGLTLIVLGPDTYRDYVEHVLPHLRAYYTASGNVSLNGFWHQVFVGMDKYGRTQPVWYSPAAAPLTTAASRLAVVGLVVWVTVRAEWDHAFALAITAMILVSPVAWNHYFLLLLLPIALLWRSSFSSWPWRAAFWLCCSVLLCMGPKDFQRLTFDTIPRNASGRLVALPWQAMTVLSLHYYALLGFFAIAARAALLRPAPSQALRSATKREQPIREPAVPVEPRLLQTASWEGPAGRHPPD